jgi:hypothetical protein
VLPGLKPMLQGVETVPQREHGHAGRSLFARQIRDVCHGGLPGRDGRHEGLLHVVRWHGGVLSCLVLLSLGSTGAYEPCQKLRRSIPEPLGQIVFGHIQILSVGIAPPQRNMGMRVLGVIVTNGVSL